MSTLLKMVDTSRVSNASPPKTASSNVGTPAAVLTSCVVWPLRIALKLAVGFTLLPSIAINTAIEIALTAIGGVELLPVVVYFVVRYLIGAIPRRGRGRAWRGSARAD